MITKRLLIAAALGLGLGLTASATTFFEVGDAGDLPSNAQDATVSGILTEIRGIRNFTLDVDVYRIFIYDPSIFFAFTTDGLDPSSDPQLFLFDSTGRGVYSNDDGFSLQSFLPPLHPLGPKTAGVYYLAIAFVSNKPINASGLIFQTGDPTDVLGPDPTQGGLLPVTGWNNDVDATPTPTEYGIMLSGVSAVPEPASMMMASLALALGAVGLRTRRRY